MNKVLPQNIKAAGNDDDGCHTLSEIEERWGERLVAGRVLGVRVDGRGAGGTIFNFLLRREEEGRLGRDLTGQRSRDSKQTTFYKI